MQSVTTAVARTVSHLVVVDEHKGEMGCALRQLSPASTSEHQKDEMAHVETPACCWRPFLKTNMHGMSSSRTSCKVGERRQTEPIHCQQIYECSLA